MYSLVKYPGKFEANRSQKLAEVISNCVNDGWAETVGSVEDFGFFAFVKGKRYGFILEEDSQGFVTVESFSDLRQAEKEWDKIECLYSEYCDTDQEEENI